MIRNALLIVVLALVAAFTFLNWTALSMPMALSLGFTSTEAPIGLVLLSIVALLGAGFAAWAITLQANVLAETRRHTRELQAQRELADKAEASRFVELREFVRTSLEQTSNTLAAHMGEIEDRLDRGRIVPPDVSRDVTRTDVARAEDALLLPPRR